MKKLLLTLIAVTVGFGSAIAASSSNPDLYDAIKKYKTKNYVGCIQDMKDLVKKDPSNAVAYYYLAISYANIGKKNEAITAYQKVAALSTNTELVEYAAKGEKCLTTPEECKTEEKKSIELEIDKFIESGSTFSKEANEQIQQIRMEQLKNNINSEADQKSEMPTNDEIAEAVKTLAKAGVNTLQMAGTSNPYAAMQSMYQNPEYMQLQMLMGTNNRAGGTDFMSMLPYFMSQGNAGTTNPNISADMIKNMMMSSMMGDMTTTFDMDGSK